MEDARVRVAALNADLKKAGVFLLEQRLDFSELGREIDKQTIGKYVAAKMGLMLNSKLFCQSMRRCNEPEGKAENKVKPEQLKEIFPGLDRDVFKNTDFWSAANKLRSEGAPAPAASK